MTGLDKIVKEILDEAKAEAEQTKAKAQAEADDILAKARAEADEGSAKIAAAARHNVADIEQSRQSALELQRRQKLLEAKQELLNETLEKALGKLYALPDGDYFALCARLAVKTAQPGEGELLFNAKDKARLPAGFEGELAGQLPAGSAIKVSGGTRPLDGGFVLKYGDVEENCSFRAIFDERREEFSDAIRGILFPQ